MNEFTKEELNMLKGGISLWMEEISFQETSHDDPYPKLLQKLKSIIEDYCDHTWKEIYEGKYKRISKCTKCGEYTREVFDE